MRKALTIFIVLCLTLCLSIPVLASDVSNVMDEADLLTVEEEALLEAVCAEGEAYGCGIYIVTVEDFTRWDSRDPYVAAQNIYLERGLGVGENTDGIMLMLSMAERDYSLIVHGYVGNDVFTDSVLDDIEAGFLDDFRSNDWYGGFDDFVSDSVFALSVYDPNAESVPPYDFDRPVDMPYTPLTVGEKLAYMPISYRLMIVAVPPVIALIVCLLMKKQLKTAGIATRAEAYIPGQGVRLSVQQDVYTHTTTRVIHHSSDDDFGGGGFSGSDGGFSGRSGKF